MFHSVAVDELGESAAFIVADAFRHITAVGAQGVGDIRYFQLTVQIQVVLLHQIPDLENQCALLCQSVIL